METDIFRIPKRLQAVSLWVHPEGKVVGSIFLHLQSNTGSGEEQPLEVMNQVDPFLVVKCDDPEELRFYSKKSIVRVQYEDAERAQSAEIVELPCCLHMMDGSMVEGVIKEFLPPEHSRLFDYINIVDQMFIKTHLQGGEVCMVNKSYVMRITPIENPNSSS